MEAAACGGLGLLHRVGREDVSNLVYEPCGGKRFFDIVPLQVNIGIYFVRDAVVALVLFEADIVSGGATQSVWPLTSNGAFQIRK